MSQRRSRAYCFTINNPNDEDKSDVRNLQTTARYVIVGLECGESGTPHLQGYAYFKSAKTLSAVKNLLKRAHIESAKGTPQQNKEYCSKDGEIFLEFGDIPISAKDKGRVEKERWAATKKAAKENRLDDIDDDLYIRYYRTLKLIAKDHIEKVRDADDVTGVWIYGEAGVGKSRKAREDYPEAYFKMCNKWWDGYRDQDYVIIDDLDPNHSVLGHHLKIWSDRYAFLAETKGGAMMIRPAKIIITSQYSIDEIFSDHATREALKRRFQIIKME